MTPQKIFLETSFLIRFFTRDVESKYADCATLLAAIEAGQFKPYTSNVVVMEVVFILSHHYRFPLVKIVKALKKFLKLKNLTLIEKTNTHQALRYLMQFKIKYGDCLIASQIPKGTTLVTYDADFKKIPRLKVATPKELFP